MKDNANSDWMETFVQSSSKKQSLWEEHVFHWISKSLSMEERYLLFLKCSSYQNSFICKLLIEEEYISLQTIHPHSQNNIFHALCQSSFASNEFELYPIFEELFYIIVNTESNFSTIQKLLGTKNILGHFPLHFVSHPMAFNLIATHMHTHDLQLYHSSVCNESSTIFSNDLLCIDSQKSILNNPATTTAVQMVHSFPIGFDTRLQLKFGWKLLRDVSNKIMSNSFKLIDFGNNQLWALNALGQPMYYDFFKYCWNVQFALFFQTISSSVVSNITLASTILGAIRKKRNNDFAFDLFNGLTLTGLGLKSVSCGSEEVIYSIGNNQKIFRFSKQKSKWIELENQKVMKYIDCNASDDCYGLDEFGNFYKRVHSVRRWELMGEGTFRQICVLEDGTVLAIDANQRACRYFPKEQQWKLLSQSEHISFCCITGDAIGNFYALHSNQQQIFMFQSMGFNEWEDLC